MSWIRARYYLANKNRKNGAGLLCCRLSYKSKEATFSLGFSIHTDQWDIENERVVKHVNKTYFNYIIQQFAAEVQRLASEALLSGADPLAHIKATLRPVTVKPPTLLESLQQAVAWQTGKVADNTLKSYKTLLNNWEAFEESAAHNFELADVGPDLQSQFVGYLSEVKGNANGVIQKNLKVLKTLLRTCKEHKDFKGTVDPDAINPYAIKLDTVFHVALTEKELDTLWNLPLTKPEAQRLARVRDLFCLACFTGLRYSDLEQLKPEHRQFDQDEKGRTRMLFSVQTRKTGARVNVPIHDKAAEVLSRLGLPLPLLSNAKMNEYLKELGQLAKLTSPVLRVSMRLNDRQESTVPKYELITCHTARRTYATFAYSKGLPLIQIRDILGHTRVEQTELYIKASSFNISSAAYSIWDDQ